MRHWGTVASLALGAALGISLGSIAWPVDPVHVQGDLVAALGPVEAPAAATLTLLPRPKLRIRHVKWSAASGALKAEAAGADVDLSFHRLLTGRFEPLGVTLRDAVVHIDVRRAGAALKALVPLGLPRVELEGGSIEIASAETGWRSRFEVGAVRADWSTPEGSLRATASGRWRSQPVEATVELDAPLAAAHGDASAASLAVDSPLGQLRFSGDLSWLGRLDGALYRGQMSALIPSIERFSRWLGRDLPPGYTPAGLELKSRVTSDRRQLRLADASIVLGGQAFEGALDVLRTAAGLSVSGTLAADALDLEALIGPPPDLLDGSGGWSTAPALPSPSDKLDLDLRVSATRAVWRGHAIDNAAAAVSQRDGEFSIKLLEASFARGSLSGEISVDNKQGVCQSKFAASVENADLGALLADFGERSFVGQGAVKASFRARGRSPSEIAATADGEASLEIADGALRSLNFEEALRRGRRRLIDVARDMNAGATRFASAKGRLEISNGEARFVDVATQAPGVSLAVTGAIDLVGRAWRARVAARQSDEDGQPTPEGAHLDFALDGPWTRPAFVPVLPPAD